jgi:apolipoprotein D and lipocalin family protein
MRKIRKILAMSSVAILAGCAAQHPDLPTQANVNLKKYAGTWYEQARLPNNFQKDCVGDVRADYGLRPDGTFAVTNRCRQADGSIETASGEARLAGSGDRRNPAKLEVRFAPKWTSWLPMVWGDYWIIRIRGDYQYSLVGTPNRKYLWVLSRKKKADEAAVDALLDYARNLGFSVSKVKRTGG